MIKTNILKEKLKNNELVLGTWSSTSSANIVNVLGTTNLDFVVIDLEHASMTSNVNNVGNGCRERNPWDAIRQDDVTSLTYLLQHGAVDETSYDPDTGKEF